MDKLNKLIQQNASQKTISEYCTKYGLRKKPSILNQLTWNRHLQTPQDTYHAIAGKIQKLMECTFSILKPSGEATFLNYWRNLEIPIGWYQLPNPIKHRNSFIFSDCMQLAMVMPFLLRRSLTISHIKDFELGLLKERLMNSTKSCLRPAQIINVIISCWVAVAKVSCLSFSFSFTEQTYRELKDALRIEHDILLKVIFVLLYSKCQLYICNLIV